MKAFMLFLLLVLHLFAFNLPLCFAGEILSFVVPPYIVDQKRGIVIDILNSVKAPDDVITILPTKRARNSYIKDPNAIIIGSRLTLEPLKETQYLLVFIKIVYGVHFKPEKRSILHDKKDCKIAVLRGLSHVKKILNETMAGCIVIEIDSYTQAGDMVLKDRVDAVVADLNTRSDLTKNSPGAILDFEPINKMNISAGLLSRNKERLLKLKLAIEKLQANEQYETILARYLQPGTVASYRHPVELIKLDGL
ncbi:MAG TPA: transporter substrate-binding domain-containing protein [Oligoflexus sp.]|uniref:substrate-binding periplasmic protein n=1 Tax=Oligoflexus sp. TaxID=1971216 RepID=UPI002D491601|nr:transporter substrate-binding domain-containing protein [Oligoflexus sp.]HYX37594.1 transporter substrate-binding domain-containing protein [Oligoflexus sp.]